MVVSVFGSLSFFLRLSFSISVLCLTNTLSLPPFSPVILVSNPSVLCAVGSYKVLHFIDVETGAPIATMPAHSMCVYTCDFHPSENIVCSAGDDKLLKVRVLVVVGFVVIAVCAPIESNHISFVFLSFLIDSRFLRQIWDLNSGKCVSSITSHQSWIWKARFSPDGTRLASASQDHSAKVRLVALSMFQSFVMRLICYIVLLSGESSSFC